MQTMMIDCAHYMAQFIWVIGEFSQQLIWHCVLSEWWNVTSNEYIHIHCLHRQCCVGDWRDFRHSRRSGWWQRALFRLALVSCAQCFTSSALFLFLVLGVDFLIIGLFNFVELSCLCIYILFLFLYNTPWVLNLLQNQDGLTPVSVVVLRHPGYRLRPYCRSVYCLVAAYLYGPY